MPDIIKVNKGKGIIEVRSHGELTQRDMESSIAKVLKILKKDSINKVLIYTTELQSMPRVIEIYEIMSLLPQNIKVALFIDKDNPMADDIIFGETVALHSGAQIKVFSQVNDAVKWLDK